MKNIILSFLTISLIVACGSANLAKLRDAADYKYFGEKIDTKGAISYDTMLSKMGDKQEIPTKVVGTIESVCLVKGCWINMVSEDATKESMFVKFKDYGFFMPMDSQGKKVILDGIAFREETTVEELKHYAEDEGKTPNEIAAITEPIFELKFMASGAILIDK